MRVPSVQRGSKSHYSSRTSTTAANERSPLCGENRSVPSSEWQQHRAPECNAPLCQPVCLLSGGYSSLVPFHTVISVVRLCTFWRKSRLHLTHASRPRVLKHEADLVVGSHFTRPSRPGQHSKLLSLLSCLSCSLLWSLSILLCLLHPFVTPALHALTFKSPSNQLHHSSVTFDGNMMAQPNGVPHCTNPNAEPADDGKRLSERKSSRAFRPCSWRPKRLLTVNSAWLLWTPGSR